MQTDKIAITPMVCDELDLPESARNALNMKLMQMATANGFGSMGGDFILTANVRAIDKQVTATAPAQYIIELEVSIYVINLKEKLLAAETSFTVKAIDNNENKAKVRAINQIKPRTPAVNKFMTTAREKIIDYYATRVPALLAKSQSFVSRGEYDEAISVLAVIPECLDDYPMVAKKMSEVFTQMIDREAATLIQQAKSELAKRHYEEALDFLVEVDPLSTNFDKATSMVASIKRTIDANERAKLRARLEQIERQREIAQRAHDDDVMLRKMQIEASQQIAVAKAMSTSENKKAESQNLLKEWLFGIYK